MSGKDTAASVAKAVLLASAVPPINFKNSMSAITTAWATEAAAKAIDVLSSPALLALLFGLATNAGPKDASVAVLVVWAAGVALRRIWVVRLAEPLAEAAVLEAKLMGELLVSSALTEASPLIAAARRIEVVNAPAAVEVPACAEPNNTVVFREALEDATAVDVAARRIAVVSEALAVETPACAESKNAPIERSALIDAVAVEAAANLTDVVRAPLDAAVAAGVADNTI